MNLHSHALSSRAGHAYKSRPHCWQALNGGQTCQLPLHGLIDCVTITYLTGLPVKQDTKTSLNTHKLDEQKVKHICSDI